jgi:drug/metabolite transporter (DMT)-like permease
MPLRDKASQPDVVQNPADDISVDHGRHYTLNSGKIWHNQRMSSRSRHTNAVLLGIFITFLWSTSWVLIKIGLRNNLPPLTFAGLRYFMGFLCLAPFVLGSSSGRATLKNLSRADWGRLILLGLVVITLTQGGQFLSLAYLPAAMVSLVLNTTSVFVGLAGIYFLKELPSRLQWVGIAITIIGVCLYFLPITVEGMAWAGLIAALVTMLGNVASSLMSRKVNLQNHISPIVVSFISIGMGSTVLLGIGIFTQGLGTPTLTDWLIILWLAVVNTAFAYTVWNHTLQTLTAVDASVINSLMMPQVAILAFIFLGETLTPKEILGMLLVGVGVIVVQLRKR